VAGKVPKTLKRDCDSPAKALGAVITELRLQKGWPYHYVSSKVDCDPSYMSGMEHGRQNPTFAVLKAVADLHKLKLSQLIARAERKYENCSKKKG
jgi:transcriptional regulator with XRE-family HTH domain